MKDYKAHWYSLTYVLAFVIGVILFWAFGKDWLDLESVPIFLAGLLGIAVAVILFGAWNIRHNSNHEEK
jgi:4-amino-4-deoxy-L-arabinose transferase-like glycosyltransferase